MASSPNSEENDYSSTPESPGSNLSSPNVSPSPSTEDQPPLSSSFIQRSPVTGTSTITGGMTASSTPLGNVSAARKPQPTTPTMARGGGGIPPEMAAKLKAFQIGRQGSPSLTGNNATDQTRSSGSSPTVSSSKLGPGGVPANFQLPGQSVRAGQLNFKPPTGAPQPNIKQSLAQKRGMTLPGGLPGQQSAPPAPQGGKKRPGLTLSQMNAGADSSEDQNSQKSTNGGSLLEKYSDFLDAKTGSLKFKGKAVLTSQGVEFEGGKTYNISLDEVDNLDELGKGNYGTVFKVRHSRPRGIRRPGLGLAGHKSHSSQQPLSPTLAASSEVSGGLSGEVMALKEIRLELDDAKLHAIIMELDILHRCISPFIVDFLGAFFQEGAVYICMEFMDGGSIDKLYGDGVPESVLRKLSLSATMGLKTLKDDHNIIHRDVKPTNILVNTRGQIKLCDFGVSGNLVASIAKTNIGCQSYMAPERISSGGVAQTGNTGGGTYSVQSDIWSLGLTITECAMGQYPYPQETYDNIFSQLSAIVDGDPPDLPADRFSEQARDFVSRCLLKSAKMRPNYATLLQHPWISPLLKPPTISEEDEEEGAEPVTGEFLDISNPAATTEDKEVAEWVISALEKRRNGKMTKKAQPALHAAPLDVTSPVEAKKGEEIAVEDIKLQSPEA